MHVKEIIQVKGRLESLKEKGVIREWELPYENLLTRLSAAVFFLTPQGDGDKKMTEVEKEFNEYEYFSYRPNHENKLSKMSTRITFSKEDKEKSMDELQGNLHAEA